MLPGFFIPCIVRKAASGILFSGKTGGCMSLLFPANVCGKLMWRTINKMCLKSYFFINKRIFGALKPITVNPIYC